MTVSIYELTQTKIKFGGIDLSTGWGHCKNFLREDESGVYLKLIGQSGSCTLLGKHLHSTQELSVYNCDSCYVEGNYKLVSKTWELSECCPDVEFHFVRY